MLAAIGAMLLSGVAAGRQAPDSLPACDSLLQGLSAKIEANYAGFFLEYHGVRRAAYTKRREQLMARARRTAGDQCYFVLRELTASFHDPHLFVFQNTYRDSVAIESAANDRIPERYPTTERGVRADLARRSAKLDPIEGLWTDGTLRVAIVPAVPANTGHFTAVVLTGDTAFWQPGEVRARFARRPDGRYDAVLQERNLAKRFAAAALYKRHLMRFDPGMWARELPLAPRDSGLVSMVDPHRATLVWRGSTPVLSVPSNDPTYRSTLDGLLASNRDAIAKAPRFIIDIRGNEGGSSWVTDGLLELIRSAPRPRAAERPDDGQMLSSPDQIEYVRTNWQNVVSDSLSSVRLLERMVAHPGVLVPMSDSAEVTESHVARPVDSLPSAGAPAGPRVGILVDGGTVSAAEVFLLRAMRYAGVTVFGTPTAGALDYQSVQIVRIGDSGRRWYLGYPTIAASKSLPAGGMRGRGIAPDRRVDWRTIKDPIGYVDVVLSAMASP